jgi:carbonic anhydrase/acetyltransferase-like protein (isoleucine patch superfamily)
MSTQLITFDGRTPVIDPSAWVAPTAVVIGNASVGAGTGVYYGAVVRADTTTITVGAGSNLQDGVIVHADPSFPATIGDGVTVGHGAVLHGCTVQDDCLIGMRAGAVVLEGMQIPPGSLVAGVPGKVRRPLTDEERAALVTSAAGYVERSAAHKAALDN